MAIAILTSRNSSNMDFYLASRKSPWFVVAFGMIGASLSGVTFISIPGAVGAGGLNMQFSYMQVVFGYLVGYFIIATVLMPLYYRLNLTSIYGYLDTRFGRVAYKTGSSFFLLSRVLGASMRLYLVSLVLHSFVLGPLGISFFITVLVSILLIWSYTFIGGIKTIIWTDTVQTACMLIALILTIFYICNSIDISLLNLKSHFKSLDLGQMFFFENGWGDPNNFYKQFFSGALLALVMTGLDQDMMQKNLSCKTLKDAQKNIFVFSIILIFANLLFLSLGALLYSYAAEFTIAIPDRTDQLYPMLALQHFPTGIAFVFILGLIAAAYSSADSALTSLTTSFSVDILGIERSTKLEAEKKRIRQYVHLGFSLLLFFIIMAVNALNDDAIINTLFIVAGYTYGPLLGMFAFGILTKRKVLDKWIWLVCILSPIMTFIIDKNSAAWFGGLKLGFLVLACNGLLCFLGLFFLSLTHVRKDH